MPGVRPLGVSAPDTAAGPPTPPDTIDPMAVTSPEQYLPA